MAQGNDISLLLVLKIIDIYVPAPLPQLKNKVDKTLYLMHDLTHFHLQIFHKRMPPEAVDLVSRLLQYSPNLRCTAVSNTVVYDLCFCILRLSKTICSLIVYLPLFLNVLVNESIDNCDIDMTSVRIILIIICCVGLLFFWCSWRHWFIHSLMSCVTQMLGYLMDGLFHHCSTLSHMVSFFDSIQFSFHIWWAVFDFII